MLSDIQVRKAKPQEKPYKLADERALYMLINPTGAKLWRMNYRFNGKQKTLALGISPHHFVLQHICNQYVDVAYSG